MQVLQIVGHKPADECLELEGDAGLVRNLRGFEFPSGVLPAGKLYLRGAILSFTYCCNSGWRQPDCEGASFEYAILCQSFFARANSDRADFRGTNLRDATFREGQAVNADFSGASLHGVTLDSLNISGARFSDKLHGAAEALTQAALNKARADAGNPPNLNGVVDAATGNPLVWQGSTIT